MNTYPRISSELQAQLALIVPSRDGKLAYYPCSVTLSDGSREERVFLVEYGAYLEMWGGTPEADPGKRSVSLRNVRAIVESPFRLPPLLASELYSAGESGMGYCIFTVEFRDGRRQAYLTGNAVDFISPPSGLCASDARKVFPHLGREAYVEGPSYSWCIYREAAAPN